VEDSLLAPALAAGDHDAWDRLVVQETPAVFRTCYRILGRIEEAEDAAQETFLAAYRGIGSFRGDNVPRAWLTRIATRESWRRAARSRRLPQVSTSLADDVSEQVADDSDPLGETLSAEQREQVRQAVARLPEPYREVVTLRFMGELSIADIAVVTARPEGTIKAQLHRGLERLRREVGGLVTA
jgi:RNA polymerase sigma-70 factor (ECF subfamily)